MQPPQRVQAPGPAADSRRNRLPPGTGNMHHAAFAAEYVCLPRSPLTPRFVSAQRCVCHKGAQKLVGLRSWQRQAHRYGGQESGGALKFMSMRVHVRSSISCRAVPNPVSEHAVFSSRRTGRAGDRLQAGQTRCAIQVCGTRHSQHRRTTLILDLGESSMETKACSLRNLASHRLL